MFKFQSCDAELPWLEKLSLFSKRASKPDSVALYFVTPSADAQTRIVDDAKALESRVFHLGETDALHTLFSHDSIDSLDIHIEDLAYKFFDVLTAMNVDPIIQYHDPAGSKRSLSARMGILLRVLLDQHKEEELKQDKEYPEPTPYDHHGPPTVIIVDRSIDLVSPVLHSLSFQAAVHDSFPVEESAAIQGGKNLVFHVEQEGKEDVIMDETSPVFNTLRHLFYSQAIDEYKKALKKIEDFTKNSTIDEMKEKVLYVTEVASTKEQLASLLILMTELVAEIENRRQLLDMAAVEQDLATGKSVEGATTVRKSTIKKIKEIFAAQDELISPEYQVLKEQDRWRILLIFALTFGQINEPDFQDLFAASKVNKEDYPIFGGLTFFNINAAEIQKSVALDKVAASSNGWNMKAIFGGGNSTGTSEAADGNDFPHFDRYEPFISRIIQGHLNEGLNDEFHVAKGKDDKATFKHQQTLIRKPAAGNKVRIEEKVVTKFSGFTPKWGRARPKAPGDLGGDYRNNGAKTIVIILGGLTYAEVRAAYIRGVKEEREVFIGSTHIISANDFMDALHSFGTLDRIPLNLLDIENSFLAPEEEIEDATIIRKLNDSPSTMSEPNLTPFVVPPRKVFISAPDLQDKEYAPSEVSLHTIPTVVSEPLYYSADDVDRNIADKSEHRVSLSLLLDPMIETYKIDENGTTNQNFATSIQFNQSNTEVESETVEIRSEGLVSQSNFEDRNSQAFSVENIENQTSQIQISASDEQNSQQIYPYPPPVSISEPKYAQFSSAPYEPRQDTPVNKSAESYKLPPTLNESVAALKSAPKPRLPSDKVTREEFESAVVFAPKPILEAAAPTKQNPTVVNTTVTVNTPPPPALVSSIGSATATQRPYGPPPTSQSNHRISMISVESGKSGGVGGSGSRTESPAPSVGSHYSVVRSPIFENEDLRGVGTTPPPPPGPPPGHQGYHNNPSNNFSPLANNRPVSPATSGRSESTVNPRIATVDELIKVSSAGMAVQKQVDRVIEMGIEGYSRAAIEADIRLTGNAETTVERIFLGLVSKEVEPKPPAPLPVVAPRPASSAYIPPPMNRNSGSSFSSQSGGYSVHAGYHNLTQSPQPGGYAQQVYQQQSAYYGAGYNQTQNPQMQVPQWGTPGSYYNQSQQPVQPQAQQQGQYSQSTQQQNAYIQQQFQQQIYSPQLNQQQLNSYGQYQQLPQQLQSRNSNSSFQQQQQQQQQPRNSYPSYQQPQQVQPQRQQHQNSYTSFQQPLQTQSQQLPQQQQPQNSYASFQQPVQQRQQQQQQQPQQQQQYTQQISPKPAVPQMFVMEDNIPPTSAKPQNQSQPTQAAAAATTTKLNSSSNNIPVITSGASDGPLPGWTGPWPPVLTAHHISYAKYKKEYEARHRQ
ncbi:vacuolar sorting protein VPS33/slp1 [Physocladia obscura]|uniref:Vacuolar sorting protein VPS33/slp1 n=1 Tax=Physocladia obscura TaxID=109957 RepID=A0AAD5XEN6_9FUNG|nr:vacuolar sorting protein VPS33/slp1 [Physocladia obscura]